MSTSIHTDTCPARPLGGIYNCSTATMTKQSSDTQDQGVAR